MKIQKLVQIIFFKETIFLIFGLVWLWFSISLFTDAHYTLADLKPHYGIVERMDSSIVKVVDKPLFKQVTKQLQIKLYSDINKYSIETTENFGDLSAKLSIGDTIVIYTKPKYLGVFGLKKGSAISHLTKNKEILISYSSYKNSISGFFYLTGTLSVVLILVYIVRLKKRLWWDFEGYKKVR